MVRIDAEEVLRRSLTKSDSPIFAFTELINEFNTALETLEQRIERMDEELGNALECIDRLQERNNNQPQPEMIPKEWVQDLFEYRKIRKCQNQWPEIGLNTVIDDLLKKAGMI